MTKPIALAAALAVSVSSFAFAQSAQQQQQERQKQEQQREQQQQQREQQQREQQQAREQQPGQQQESAEQQKQDEQMFVKEAASGNELEVKLGQFIQQKAQDPQVKQLAQKLVQDHQQANQQLKQVAQQMGVQWQDQLEPKDQAMLQEMQKKQGKALERAFIFSAVGDHHKDILSYEWQSQHAQSPQLKQYCQQTLEHLRQHLQEADQVAEAVTGVHDAQTASGRIQGQSSQSGSSGSTK